MTEDEIVGWHHQLNGHEFECTLGVGDGQGGLACPNSDSPEDKHQEWGPVRECREGSTLDHTKQQNGLCSLEAIKTPWTAAPSRCSRVFALLADVTPTLASASAERRA